MSPQVRSLARPAGAIFVSRVASEQFLMEEHPNPAVAQRTTDTPSLYAVDDVPDLTELYTTLLGAAGYTVRAFNDRAKALAALKAERRRPALLITDYRGRSMPVERFLYHCLEVHPALRIVMASGFCEEDVQLFETRPSRFLRKPFTAGELRQEIRAALAG